jgi:hypothetical protein
LKSTVDDALATAAGGGGQAFSSPAVGSGGGGAPFGNVGGGGQEVAMSSSVDFSVAAAQQLPPMTRSRKRTLADLPSASNIFIQYSAAAVALPPGYPIDKDRT